MSPAESLPTRVMSNAFDGRYANKRVLITGHTGFKGAWLSVWLHRLGADICGYSRDVPTQPSLFEAAALQRYVRHEIGDIRHFSRLSETIRSFKPDFIFHLAAQAIVSLSYHDPIETLSSNVLGTATLLQALRNIDRPCVVVNVTSDKCYENVEQPWGYREIDQLGGKDVYSASKGAAEIVSHSFHQSFFSQEESAIRLVSARAGNVLGGGDWAADRIVADCIRAWLRKEAVVLRRPSSTRPWQHVLEPLSGYLCLGAKLAGDRRLSGESFNFGPRVERNHTVADLLRDLAATWAFDQASEAFTALDNPPFAEAGLLKLNCDKALQILGWEASLTYAECVEMTGRWYDEVLRMGRPALEATHEQLEAYVQLASERHRNWTAAGL